MHTEEPRHFNELCRCIGLVILRAQTVESSLARYLVVSMKLDQGIANEKANQILTSLDKEPIGSILKSIAKDAPLPIDLTDLFSEIKEERNWLVHRLHRENPRAICNEEAASIVFRRIEKLSSTITKAEESLDTIGLSIMEKHGFDNDSLTEQAKQRTSERFRNA